VAKHAPQGLGKGGLSLWKKVAKLYELRPDELETLEDVCRITDMIDELYAVWDKEYRPMTTEGSKGQLVIHLIIGELRAQRLARNVLWRQLKLPDLDGGEQPNQHRAAAFSRWAARGGVK
jgi:hypothetical protein